jgi:hypothetical protein
LAVSATNSMLKDRGALAELHATALYKGAIEKNRITEHAKFFTPRL